MTAVDVWLRAGASAEPETGAGMAHFLEHLIFKGTARLEAGFFDAVVESNGGVTNAVTSHDYAHYYILAAASHIPETLPYLAELLLHATIPDAEFERERQVVLEEMRHTHDNPDWVGLQRLAAHLYPAHPYGRSVLGSEIFLQQWTPQDVRSFHRRHYQPENMMVVVVGNSPQEQVMDWVMDAFQTVPSPDPGSGVERRSPAPLLGIQREDLTSPRLENARLLMAWQGPGVDQIDQAYGLELLSMVLGEGRSSRLVRLLREEHQWVYSISSHFSLQRDASALMISAYLESQHLDRVEAMICEQLYELGTRPISELELMRFQQLLCNNFVFSTETPGQLAGLYGFYGAIAQPELATAYPQGIRALQVDTIQHLAQQYLRPECYATVRLQGIPAQSWIT